MFTVTVEEVMVGGGQARLGPIGRGEGEAIKAQGPMGEGDLDGLPYARPTRRVNGFPMVAVTVRVRSSATDGRAAWASTVKRSPAYYAMRHPPSPG